MIITNEGMNEPTNERFCARDNQQTNAHINHTYAVVHVLPFLSLLGYSVTDVCRLYTTSDTLKSPVVLRA